MNKTHLLALLISLAVASTFTSCKKDDTEKPVVFPLNFYSEKIQVVALTRMFTKTGEIKDPKIIAKFTANEIYFRAESDQTGKGELALKFLSKEKVIFGGSVESFPFTVTQSDDQFLFKSEVLYSSPSFLEDNFSNHLFKHEHVVTSASGGVQFRDVRVGYGNYTEMRLPLIAYKTYTADGASSYSTGGIINNEFNEAALSHLQTNDTLAIKSYHLICKSR